MDVITARLDLDRKLSNPKYGRKALSMLLILCSMILKTTEVSVLKTHQRVQE